MPAKEELEKYQNSIWYSIRTMTQDHRIRSDDPDNFKH